MNATGRVLFFLDWQWRWFLVCQHIKKNTKCNSVNVDVDVLNNGSTTAAVLMWVVRLGFSSTKSLLLTFSHLFSTDLLSYFAVVWVKLLWVTVVIFFHEKFTIFWLFLPNVLDYFSRFLKILIFPVILALNPSIFLHKHAVPPGELCWFADYNYEQQQPVGSMPTVARTYADFRSKQLRFIISPLFLLSPFLFPFFSLFSLFCGRSCSARRQSRTRLIAQMSRLQWS